MCGIHVSISTRGYLNLSESLQEPLCNRGPDHIGRAKARIDSKDGQSYSISLTSTVLALRGGSIITQPFIDHSRGSALCWNGEAWKIGADPVVGNDGQAIFAALIEASAQITASESTVAILKVLRSLSGPFAFVFMDKIHGQVYFGRDRLGRRSLLYRNTHGCFELSSIADSTDINWKEVEADGIYQSSCHGEVFTPESQIPSHHLSCTSILPVIRHAWEPSGFEVLWGPSLGTFNTALPTANCKLDSRSASISALRHELFESLKPRLFKIPVPPKLDQDHNVRIAVLFSGGLDCTVLARIAHEILPAEQHIDLINVAFENPRVVRAAMKAQTTQICQESKSTDSGNINSQNSSVGVPIWNDLSPFETCPDRKTGRKTFQELQSICPGRIWRFVAVNIPYAETITHRSNIINLIHPHNTEMDLSIAYALYFAARGTGIPSSNLGPEPPTYTTPARVLLSGLGADELFGGYTRHATAFDRTGYQGLLGELELDVKRLGKRNLGRDDRVISHWGREARFPYLDECLVKWAVECPIWEKCGFQTKISRNPEASEIEPGKKVLRLLADELGLKSVAREKKRAIQFGARTAKMESGRAKGTSLIS